MDMEIRALATANALLGALVKPTRDEAGADVWMLCRDVRYQVLVLYWRDTPLSLPRIEGCGVKLLRADGTC